MGKFNPPASTDEIDELECMVGPLPLDFKAYLRIANGQKFGGQFFGDQQLLNCKEIADHSREYMDIGKDDQEIPLMHEGVWFHPGALIFEALDGGGYAINATSGVIYSWDHDGGPLKPIANSFTDMLEWMLACLQAGEGPTCADTRWAQGLDNK